MFSSRTRNIFITVFVILWLLIYHYMSIKHFYLEPLFKRPLARVPMLFPPAGWIMFYNVEDRFGEVNIYGMKGVNIEAQGDKYLLKAKEIRLIDPHAIFRTRTIFFDNIQRGLMHGAVGRQKDFCNFLEYRFPYYDAFEVRYTFFPSITKEPYKQIDQTFYQCLTKHYVENERHQ